MMLTIHGLPTSVKYQELKTLIKQKCNISQFILDNLVSEEDGTKKVRIGVSDENEGSILIRSLDGYSMNGYRLRIQPVGKTPLLTTPKQASYDSRVNYEHKPEYSHQTMDPHGSNRALYSGPTSRPTNYPYQHGGDVSQQPKIDSGPYSQREVYAHNRPQEQNYGYQHKPNVPIVTENRRVVEIRPNILRTVELERGSISKPYQPTLQTYTQPQQKPVTIFKDNFQGPTHGYNFNQMNQPMQQSYQGRQDITRPVWTQEQNKLQQVYGKTSTVSYDKSVYNEERKFPQHSSAENPQTRGLLKTPTNYDQPKYSHTPQSTRMSPLRRGSPERRSSPVRRLSPDKRLISPQVRQDLRKLSPSRRISPRRRMSPGRRPSPRKSPTGNRRLLSPPPRRLSPSRASPPSRKSYYEAPEKHNSRSSGHLATQVRSAYEKQTAQNQYSGGYGPSSSQNRAPPPTKSSGSWQGTKAIYPRDSLTERDVVGHAPENKYQSGTKSTYSRESPVEIVRHAPENKYQQGTKSSYRRDSPVEHTTIRHIPENKYQHFDILSVKDIHRASPSAPLKRSRSPIRRNRTPPRGSPRKQSPSRRQWPQDRRRSPVARFPPSPPSWPDRSRNEKEQPNVWQRNEELRQHNYHHKSEDDWKKDTGFVGSTDKYEDRSDFAQRSGDGIPVEKYRKVHDEPRRRSSPQRKEYYSRQEDDHQRREFKHQVLNRPDPVLKHHEDYAKPQEQYSKHRETLIKYPEPFAKRGEPFNKNSEHLYKRHEQLPSRHGQFSNDDGQFSNQKRHLLHPKHQESFPKRQEPLLKYEEPVVRFQEPLLKFEESVAKRHEPLPKYAEPITKRQESYSRPLEQFTRHQESFSKRQESFPIRQDQYTDHRDDHFRSDENRKQSEGFRYNADNKRIDSRLGHSDNAPRYEGKETAQKPEPGFMELTKRAQDWAQGIGKYSNAKETPQEEKKEDFMDPQLRQKAINVITRKILARHNVKMKDERQKKISICLRKMIEKRVNNIIGERVMNLLEIQHKFRQTYSIQDEEKMYFDAVAVYPPKRHNEDSSGGPPQKVAKGGDRDTDKPVSEPYFGKSSKKTRWDDDVHSDDRIDSSSSTDLFQTTVVNSILQGSHHESNECVEETFSLYLCKDDFSVISSEEADIIRHFLVSKIFDTTANSETHSWVPSFTMCGLRSLCRYEIETNDKHSKIWLEQFDFSDLEGLHIVVYTKEELWYERAAIWLPGHSRCRNIEPLDKLRLQNRHMATIDLSKWKLVKKIVTSLGTRIYVDMPPASARALESQKTMLSYELQKVSVFLKAIAVDKDTFDAGLRERSIDDTAELMTAIRNTPMPSVKNEPKLIKICFKGRKLINVEQAKKIKEIIVFQLYKYHLQNDIGECSRTDFVKYGFCLPGYLGVLPENRESASWLTKLDLGKFNRRELICFGGETECQNSIKMTMYLASGHSALDQQTILKNLELCNRRIKNLNIGDWKVSSYEIVKNGAKANVEIDADSAKVLTDNNLELKYINCNAIFTHEYDDIDALLNRRKEEQTDIYDITNMELASDDDS